MFLRLWLADIFNIMEDHGRYLEVQEAQAFSDKVDAGLHHDHVILPHHWSSSADSYPT